MPANHDLEQSILQLVRSPNYRPVKPRVLGKLLDLPEEHYRDLKRLIKKLVKKGQLVYGANHLIGPPGQAGQPSQGARNNFVTGVFRRTQSGFGFVRPQGAAPAADRKSDIYIPAMRAKDAASGDVVMVRLMKKADRTRPNPEGEIVEVIERETHQFVGTYSEFAGQAFVQVDGTLFAQPIAVGDPGAKNAQPGDKVVFEMVRFPSHIHEGEGVITQVLGPRGAPGVDTQSIIHEFSLPEAFADDAMHEARRQAELFDETRLDGRLDLTAETIITIDPVDARDFDDAISLVRLDGGHWRLGVHIADVVHFVRPNTALDREAHNRATSVYLPDRVLPMLPEVISNGLASLQPDRVRYTKTVFIEYTEEGIRVAADLHSAAIQSKRRFTYEEVDDFLAHRKAWQKKLAPDVHALLGRMHELAMILRGRRLKRGALELTMDEVKVDLDKSGQVVGAHRVINTESHQVIEEFMLAANEAVAQALADAELQFLRRVHMAPDPRKLEALTAFVRELGIQAESLEDRFELQSLLRAVVGQPEQHAVNYAVLRSLQRAVYSPVDEGHFALASKNYCHFTSPIRRYPDLTVHRLVDLLIAQRGADGKHGESGSAPHKPPVQDFGELVALGEHCSDRERRAEAAERELTKVKLLSYLASRIGETMDAVITGVEEFGLFAQGIELPAEGLIHISSLAGDYYRYEKASHSLVGRRAGNTFRLGDTVTVTVARVDIDRRELDFRLVARKKRAPSPAKRLHVEPSKKKRPAKKRPPKKRPPPRGKAIKRPSRPKKRRR
jgi:ribonuclease R